MAASGELDFAIIGAQKSASTYLHRVLLAHRWIDIPSVESRNFEDPWYADGGAANLSNLFGPRRTGVRRGIKRPDYLADPLVPGRMVAAAPEVRVLVVLRDPVARAVSAYLHYVRLGFLPLLPIEEAFTQILDGSLGRRYRRADDVIRYGCYGAHLRRWLAVVPREHLLVLAQQDLLDTPAAHVADVLRFLDVDAAPAADLVARTPRANISTYAPARIRVQRWGALATHDFDSGRYRRTRRSGAARLAVAGSLALLDRQVLARRDRTPMPRLGNELAHALRDRYVEDEQELTDLFGRRFWR